eukprot:3915513-Rhodomonas_salina.1
MSGTDLRAQTQVLTGGILDMEFINRYFYYQLENGDGNFAAGPFPRLLKFQGLDCHQTATLHQGGNVLRWRGTVVLVARYWNGTVVLVARYCGAGSATAEGNLSDGCQEGVPAPGVR